MRSHVRFLQTLIGLSLSFCFANTSLAAEPQGEPQCACNKELVDRRTVWSALRPASSGASPERATAEGEPRLFKSISTLVGDLAPLQVIVPEGLLNRFLATERTENGEVRDVIANTDVVGRQTTVTRIQADCRPNSQRAEVHLVLRGTVYSDTLGVTRQAAVNTLGRHAVVAVKPVMFDGHQLSTRRPRVWVDVHNEHVAAQTKLDGLPIFGGIARGTALSTAERLRPQADAETAEHLSAQVGPQFNQEADFQLARFNRLLKSDLFVRFNKLWPTTLATRTTDSHLVVSGAWDDTTNLVQPLADLDRDSERDESITVRVHESALNLALNRLPIAGKTFSERELGEIFEAFIGQLGGRVVASKPSKVATPALEPVVRFSERNPMRVSISSGQVSLVVNASIEVAGQTVLAQDEITVPLSWKAQHNAWRIDPGKLEFAKADQGISLVGMMEALARTPLANTIPTTLLPQGINLPSDAAAAPSLQIARIKATDGWLTIALAVEAFRQPNPDEPMRSMTIIRSQTPPQIERRVQSQSSMRPQTRQESASMDRFGSPLNLQRNTTITPQSVSSKSNKTTVSKAGKVASKSSRSSSSSKATRDSLDVRVRRDPAGWFD